MQFNDIFPVAAEAKYEARGRVNLLGDHTDYNHGVVLPMQIKEYTRISLSIDTKGEPNTLQLFSTHTQDNSITLRSIDDTKQGHWTDYIVGVLQQIKLLLQEAIATKNDDKVSPIKELHPVLGNVCLSDIPALFVHVHSTIPIGAGLSSSAALEVGMLKALRALYINRQLPLPLNFDIHTRLNDLEIAKLAQKAENQYVGLPCGLMDQLVISLGSTKSALFIDFYDAELPKYKHVTLIHDVQFLIIASGITHKLADTKEGDEGYKTRFEQCQQACSILGVPHLSSIDMDQLAVIISQNKLPDLLLKRVRHVVEENNRVRQALKALAKKDVALFAQCLQEGHNSYRDLYEASLPEIDELVTTAVQAGCLAARLTGGGFGGSIIAMVYPKKASRIWQTISKAHPSAKLLV